MRTLLGDVLSAMAKAIKPYRKQIGMTLINFLYDLEDIADDWDKHSNKHLDKKLK